MTPYEAVRKEYELPFPLYPFQIRDFHELAPFDRVGNYGDPGIGKTATTTHWALSKTHVKHWVLIVPPILIKQWAAWLRSIKRKNGKALTVVEYVGTPAKRKALDLNVDFIVTSYGMFKNDIDIFIAFQGRSDMLHYTDEEEAKRMVKTDRSVGYICDEAHAVKNVRSGNFKMVKFASNGRPIALLTGTPLTTPMDGFAYVYTLTGNRIYRNLRDFERQHVDEVDDYDNVTRWKDLDVLKKNMEVQAVRTLRRDVHDQLPAVTYTPIVYDLEPAHLKLYNRIAEEQLVEFEDGREIDATSTQALYSALQQVIMNWGFYADDPALKPSALDLVEEVFEELEPDGKLVIAANFIKTNRMLAEQLQKYRAVAIYGEVSPRDKQRALDQFINDKSCRCLIIQPRSAGYGIDGLQHVCSNMLFLEAPTVAPPFYQTVARLDRTGQTLPVNCRVAIAANTVQVGMFRNLLKNDATINKVQRNIKDLRDAIRGN